MMLSGSCGLQRSREAKLYFLCCGNTMPSDDISPPSGLGVSDCFVLVEEQSMSEAWTESGVIL